MALWITTSSVIAGVVYTGIGPAPCNDPWAKFVDCGNCPNAGSANCSSKCPSCK